MSSSHKCEFQFWLVGPIIIFLTKISSWSLSLGSTALDQHFRNVTYHFYCHTFHRQFKLHSASRLWFHLSSFYGLCAWYRRWKSRNIAYWTAILRYNLIMRLGCTSSEYTFVKALLGPLDQTCGLLTYNPATTWVQDRFSSSPWKRSSCDIFWGDISLQWQLYFILGHMNFPNVFFDILHTSLFFIHFLICCWNTNNSMDIKWHKDINCAADKNI